MTNSTNKIKSVAAGLLFTTSAFAGSLRGTVSDNEGGMPGADILLYKQSDTTSIYQQDVTDDNGRFSFNPLPNGRYMLKVEFVGYKTKKINFTISNAKPDIKAMAVKMQDDVEMMQAVVVTGERTALHVDADKKTFLVNSNAVTEGVSISDMLREVPSVDVDVEGTVSLRGNESVEIYINGKPAGLSDGNAAEVLEQLPASSIEKVEIITNPSSKYNAEGHAGIINIVLKDDNRKGYYGSVTGGLNVPIDGQIGGSLGASITYTTKQWTLNGSLGFQRNSNEGKRERERQSFAGADTSFTNSYAKGPRNRTSEFLRLGATYRIDEKNTISWNGLGSLAQRDFEEKYKYTNGHILNGQSIADRYSISDNETEGDRNMLSTTIDYTHTFAKEGESLSAAASFSTSKSNSTNDYLLATTDENCVALPGSMTYKNESRDERSKETTLQIDYSLPIGKGKMEMGAKGSFRNSTNESDSMMMDENAAGFADRRRDTPASATNDFEMQENIYAGYASYSGKLTKRLKYNIGLRGELTDLSWKQNLTNDKSKKDPYFNLFPSAFLSYTLNETDELQLNYTRRLARPRMRFINPYVSQNDSLNVMYGNPDLDPELTHSLELNYVKNVEGDLYTASLYYKRTDDVIARYTWLNGNVATTTFGNMSKQQSTGLELIAKNHISLLTLTTNLNFYYSQLDGGEFHINQIDKTTGAITPTLASLDENSSFSWTAKMTADLKLPASITGQISGNYMSPRALSQGRSHHMFTMNAGVRRPFLNRKLNVSFTVRDIFSTFKFRSNTYDDTFNQENEFSRGGATFLLNASYNFGNMKSSKSKGKGGEERENNVEEFEEM